MKEKIEYLILDYNRPQEAKRLLESIKEKSHFDYSVSYLSNGGEQEYVKELEQQGLIDNLILNKRNTGCGAGTIQLFAQCASEYALYVQVDQELQLPITQQDITSFIDLLKEGNFNYIDLAGDQAQGIYSERAQFINTFLYNSIPKAIGGPGPWDGVFWTESSMQLYQREHPFKAFTLLPPPFRDKGKFTVRTNPDGSVWKQRCDTKETWMLSPAFQAFRWPPFTDREWKEILETESWPAGAIPQSQKEISFDAGSSYWES